MSNSKSKFSVIAAVVAALLISAGPALGEPEAPSGNPQIDSPASGAFFGTGWSGPVTVGLTNATYGTYTVNVDCAATDSNGDPTGETTYRWSTAFDHDGSESSKSWTVPAFSGHKSECHVAVGDGNGHAADSTFYVWGLPEVTEPAAGSTVPEGWQGPITIDMVNVEAGDYSASLECTPTSGGGAQVVWSSGNIAYDGSQTVYTFNLDAAPSLGTCAVRVHNTAGDVIASNSFEVTELSFDAGPTASIAGTARVGSTLTAGAGSPMPTPDSLTYRWFADGVAIDGATTDSLVLTGAQQGKRITVTVTALKAGYTDASDTSPETGAVAAGTFTLVTPPAITGTPKATVKLTASSGSWTPTPSAFAYQWLANGATISGATGSTYTPNDSMVGKRISVRVTASKANYSSASSTSAQTAPVAASPVSITLLDPLEGYFYPYLKDGNRDVENVRFRFNRLANYRFRVINANGTVVRVSPVYGASEGQWSWDGRKGDGTLAPTGLYRVRLTAGAGGQSVTRTSDGFYVKPGPFAVFSFKRQLGYFYPYVREGNRDDQTITYSFSRTGSYRLQVINEAGITVRQTPVRTAASGRWIWDGRKGNGELAPNGKYRVRLRASAGGQTVTRISESFNLKSGYTWIQATHSSRGGDVGTPATSGACYITREPTDPGYYDEYAYYNPYAYYDPYYYYDPWTDTYTGEWVGEWEGAWVGGSPGYAEIDCWGGTGVMNYAFQVPAEAGKFTWAVNGEASGADYCCEGTITKSGERRSATVYKVSVKVTKLRAWIINGVTVNSYKKKYY